jgi:hypothetical protein
MKGNPKGEKQIEGWVLSGVQVSPSTWRAWIYLQERLLERA